MGPRGRTNRVCSDANRRVYLCAFMTSTNVFEFPYSKTVPLRLFPSFAPGRLRLQSPVAMRSLHSCRKSSGTWRADKRKTRAYALRCAGEFRSTIIRLCGLCGRGLRCHLCNRAATTRAGRGRSSVFAACVGGSLAPTLVFCVQSYIYMYVCVLV